MSQSLRLYDYAPAFEAIVSRAEDGELTPDMVAELDRLELGMAQKVENICALAISSEAMADACKAQIERLNRLAQAAQNRSRRLKEYVIGCLEAQGRTSVDTEIFGKVRIQASPPGVMIDCSMADLPEEYRKIKTTVEPDKQAILAAAREGKPLPRGITIYQGKHLRHS